MQIRDLHERYITHTDEELLGYLVQDLEDYSLSKVVGQFQLVVVCNKHEHTIVADTMLKAFAEAIILQIENE